jgi:hypothetical protein
MIHRLFACLCVSIPLLFLAGCESEVTIESYEEITVGMDLAGVELIMGGPGEIQEASGVGIGASSMLEGQSGSSRSKDYLWGDENVGILVKFKDGKVFFKQKMGL